MIKLEYFEKKDFKQLLDWIRTEELLVNWSGNLFKFPLTEEALNWYLNDTNIPASSDALIFKAIDTVTNDVVGHISLGGISRKNRSARISRVLVGDTCERGKGYCQQMITAVLQIGFEQLGLHRISLGVYAQNTSAIRCYEKCGMKQEGISRDVLWFDNEYWSLVEMSMLENEWTNAKAK